MKKNKTTGSALDAINQQFAQKQEQMQQVETKPLKPFFQRFGLLLAGMVVMIAAIVIICLSVRRQIDNRSQEAGAKAEGQIAAAGSVESTLTKEEQEQWSSQQADAEAVPIELNTRIEVQGERAAIRLLNPVYSVYPIKVRILKEKDEQVLYESERLAPGTVLETVPLKGFEKEKEEETDAVVEYTIYEAEEVKGSYQVPVKLIRKETE